MLLEHPRYKQKQKQKHMLWSFALLVRCVQQSIGPF